MQKKAAKKFQDGVMELLADGTAHLFDAVSITIILVMEFVWYLYLDSLLSAWVLLPFQFCYHCAISALQAVVASPIEPSILAAGGFAAPDQIVWNLHFTPQIYSAL